MSPETLPEENVRAAAAWYERVHQDGVSEDARSAFAAWLGQSVDHRTAYESVNETWTQVHSTALDPQILALRHETALRLTRRTSAAIRPLRWAAAAVVLIVLCGVAATLGGWLPLRESLHAREATRYATAVGERMTVTLADGSQVTLDTQSELGVAFTSSERAVRVLRGQVYFKVAKDRGRPFVVAALNRRIVAVGTEFDVRLDGAQVRVAMVEGTVRVDTATLTAGEQLIADPSIPDRVSVSDPERLTSWLHGQIVFDDTRLADAVAELNRYSNTKIELADPKIAQLHLSGAFATGRPALFIEAVTSYFPVRVVHADDRLIVLSAKR
ncbi:MAG TPA: FecR domain-containing protein [Steroidobacteraceae bacterium]